MVRLPVLSLPCRRRVRLPLALSLLALAAAPAKLKAGDSDAGAPAAAPAATPTKADVLDRLRGLSRDGRFLFGEELATLWGMYLDGQIVSTSRWYEATARAGRFTSDGAAVVGDDPAVLGVSLGMLAFEPVEWNRRGVIAAAVRHQIAQGGLVTMDWHAPSCDAAADTKSAGTLGTVNVDGHDVAIQSSTGGASFYADTGYTHPIRTRADVPDALKCVCQIANDLPLTAGPYKGLGGREWLVAQAKHAARVMRDEQLGDLPIIVRPFHEQTGSWFWWGEPYWNCAALLDRPDAVSGPEAYRAMNRAFVTALRAEPGMGELIFAYSPDKLHGPADDAAGAKRAAPAERKVDDPTGIAGGLLQQRVVRELTAAGLAYQSPARRALTARTPRATTTAAGAAAYLAQRRAFYAESYAGDDIFDLLGIDLYHPIGHPATRADLDDFRWQLRVLADEARARGKPYALTEAGTYRLRLLQLAAAAPPRAPLAMTSRQAVDGALARLFDPADRAELLRHFGLRAPGPVVLTPAQRAAVVPRPSEDWFNRQLLPLAKEAKVAYALVWQTYYDSAAADRYVYYYVPFPGHPEAAAYRRFYDDPVTCFLRDGCGLTPPQTAKAEAVAAPRP
jgi:hypothetical protein